MTHDDPGMQSQYRFVTTHWSVVLRAGKSESDDARHALDKLNRSYWYPLYAYARRIGREHHDAMDLTQGFFTQLLSGDTLRLVYPTTVAFAHYCWHRSRISMRTIIGQTQR